MKKCIRIAALLLTLLLIFSGCTAQEKVYTFTETSVTYSSGDTQVPAVVALPDGAKDMPLVVICHGHGGDHNENIGLSTIAAELAKKGIASIRMDFPGCGDSTEDFAENTMTNMKENVLDAISYVIDTYDIDQEKIGIFGYSMGGRVALELLADKAYDFAAVGLLAPAADTEDLKNLFGGAESWETMKAEANSSEERYALFTTMYGQEQHLSSEWFADLEKYSGDSLIEAAGENFDAPALVIYAVDDTVVSPSVSKAVAEALSAQVITTPEDGHDYGFFAAEKEKILRIVADAATDFFTENLK